MRGFSKEISLEIRETHLFKKQMMLISNQKAERLKTDQLSNLRFYTWHKVLRRKWLTGWQVHFFIVHDRKDKIEVVSFSWCISRQMPRIWAKGRGNITPSIILFCLVCAMNACGCHTADLFTTCGLIFHDHEHLVLFPQEGSADT